MAVAVRAKGCAATPAGYSAQDFLNEGGGVRQHTSLADLEGAMGTSHIIEGAGGITVVDR
jgi:hypothetical protein